MARRSKDDTPPTALERVYADIRSAIISGEFAVGNRITEEMLADRFQVSRTPVRAALQRLASDGFIEIAAHVGAVVKEWSPDEARQIYEVRARLEGMAARLAARFAAPADVEALQVIAEQSVVGEAGRRRSELNRHFHLRILALSGNMNLLRTAENLMSMGLLVRSYARFTSRDAQRSNLDHFDLVDAIRSGDTDWAEAIMHAHILAASNVFLEAGKTAAPQSGTPERRRA